MIPLSANLLLETIIRKRLLDPVYPTGDGPSDEGLPGVLGNKGTLAKYRKEQGNISQFLGTGEQNSKNSVRKHSENVWEHWNIGQFWKGTREQGSPPPTHPWRPSVIGKMDSGEEGNTVDLNSQNI